MPKQEPGRRESIVAPVLAELGAWELDPRGERRRAGGGRGAVPQRRRTGASPTRWPSGCAGPPTWTPTGWSWSPGPARGRAVAGLDLRWAAVTLDGRRGLVVASGPAAAPPRDIGVRRRRWTSAPVDDDGGARTWRSALVLPCWTLLGMLDRAIDLTRAYVLVPRAVRAAAGRLPGRAVPADRRRGRARRRGDAGQVRAVEHRGRPAATALDDALALRLAAIEAAEVVFRVAHQLHGAIGFCDETPLSWLSRYSQPLRRLPLGLSATRGDAGRRLGRARPGGTVHDE